MQEVDNAKEQLIAEIEQLRQRIAELEQSEIERKRAENELRESEAAARVLLNAPADVAALVDTKGIILDVNEAMAQRLGRSVDELIGVHGWDLLPADIAERRKLYFDKTIQSGKLNRFEDESGGVWFETVFYPVRDEQGKVTKVALLTRDITEHKQAEEALRESEKRYRDIFETIPASIIVLDKNGHMIDINPYHLTQIAKGQTPKEDFVGKNILTHPTIVKSGLSETYKKLLEGEPFARKDVYFPHLTTGANGYFNIRGVPFLKDDEVIGAIVIHEDITEHKLAKEELVRIRKALEGASDAIGISNPEGHHFFQNRAFSDLFEWSTAEELEAAGGGPVVYADYNVAKDVFHTIMDGRSWSGEVAMVSKNGRRFPVLLRADAIRDDTDRIIGLIGIHTDITRRKQAEEALQEKERQLQTLMDNSPVAVTWADMKGNIQYINHKFHELFGYTLDDIPTTTVWHERAYPDPASFEAYSAQVVRQQEQVKQGKVPDPIETAITCKDGSLRYMAAMVAEVSNRRMATYTDITERKRMEDLLRESEEKYRSLVESSEDSIYLVDKDCIYLFMNNKHLSRLGLKNSQVIGEAYGQFYSPEETKDFTQKVKQVLKTGKSLSYAYRSERDKRYFIRTLSPVKVYEGSTSSVITVISKDITELKQTEETLREREAFNFALFHYNPVETIVVDLKGRVTGFNLTKEKSGDRLPSIGDLMYKDYAGKHEIDMRAELIACIKSGEVKAFPERRYADKYLSIIISPFSQGALIISEDITERKRADELLKKDRDTFFAILQKAPYGVVFLDRDGKTLFVNTEFTHITGYVLEDVPTIMDWLRLVYPDKKYSDMAIAAWKSDGVLKGADSIFSKKFARAFSRTSKVVCKDKAAKEIEMRTITLEDGRTIAMLSDITERKRMYELLETATMEWRTTFDAIADAVCLLDSQAKIKRCNNAMLRMIGKSFSEIADRTCWEVLQGISDPPQRYPFLRMQRSHRRETEVFSKDNRWFEVSVDPLLDEGGNLLGGVHIMSDITDRMQVEEELQKSREQMRNLSTYLESVREQERTLIAREIHDELAQDLTALKMDLSWLGKRLPQDQKPLSDKTQSMNSLIDTTIKTVKRISAELRPGILDDLGLIAAIEWQADEFQNRTGIICHLAFDPEEITVDQERATVIFRIFQETLTNVVRHAQAKKVTVALKERAGKLTLRVKDNGKGITEEQISHAQSFGLIGMRERVYPWGGTVSISGTPGKGTTVLVNLPVVKG